MKICVYGAASQAIDPRFIKATEEMGKVLAERGHSLVFGGGSNGLMGAAARGFHAGGGHILGVIPKFFKELGVEIVYENCDKLVWPDTMRQRKQIMEDNADAFIITPGGIGTFEEFFEILTLKQLCRHNKPIAIYNLLDYYDSLEGFLEEAMDKNFIRENCKGLYFTTDNLDKLIEYIETPAEEIRSVKELKDG